jgi:SH3-like domain-containing protein
VAIYAGGGVRYEPVQDGTLYFHLAEGSRLQILEEKGEWYLIKRVDGKRGWVKKEYIGAL